MYWRIWPAESALKPDPGVDKYNCWDIWYRPANIACDPRERCCKFSVGMSIINIYDCNKYKKWREIWLFCVETWFTTNYGWRAFIRFHHLRFTSAARFGDKTVRDRLIRIKLDICAVIFMWQRICYGLQTDPECQCCSQYYFRPVQTTSIWKCFAFN